MVLDHDHKNIAHIAEYTTCQEAHAGQSVGHKEPKCYNSLPSCIETF